MISKLLKFKTKNFLEKTLIKLLTQQPSGLTNYSSQKNALKAVFISLQYLEGFMFGKFLGFTTCKNKLI